MKLEPKYICQYLPYNLKAYHTFENNVFERDVTLYNVSNFIEGDTNAKIALRPLSDLTKEIEVNGERFVPIEKLANKLFEKEGKSFYTLNDCKYWMGNHLENINYKKGYDNLIHWIFQDLVKWHFDLFLLISENLAIDINTLNQNI